MAFVTVTHAQPHEALKPLLIDLEGWDADEAEGMNLDMGSMKMLNAVREYEKGTEKLTAIVIIGNQKMEQGQMQ